MVKCSIVATAIIVRDGKYLATRRSLDEEKFPGLWTVPGGTLESDDITAVDANASGVRYTVIEELVKREVLEETGLRIDNIRYLIDMTYEKKDGPRICLSFYADYMDGDVVLDSESIDYRWVSASEALEMEFIKGIPEEILMVDDILSGKQVGTFQDYERKVEQHSSK